MSKPSDNIAEVTLIGTGGGYGESCVIHLGNQHWAIVDSCMNPTTNEILPLNYLKGIGVDISKDVKLVLCTHWHDDHIQGISNILDECKNAEFCMARASDLQKFLTWIKLDSKKISGIKASSNCSTWEFNGILKILAARFGSFLYKEALEDRPLLTVPINATLRNQVISLSPSDFTVQKFDNGLSQLIATYAPPNQKAEYDSPNYKSVVLYIKIGDYRAILGADLEVGDNNNEGWLHILLNQNTIDKKSSLLKIPHHGSENGYLKDIWTKLLEPDPTAKLTPWNRNQKLPEVEMLDIFCKHSTKVYMTKSLVSNKPKLRDRKLAKAINKFNKTLKEEKFEQGIIRCRLDFTATNSKWKVELLENALHVNIMI